MSNSQNETVSVNRRAALGGIAALSAVGAIAGSTPTLLHGDGWKLADTKLRSFKAQYALQGGDLLAASFASPRGKSGLDLVVIMPGKAGFGVGLDAKMRRYARAGKLVVAPDLAATYADRPVIGYDAMVRDVMDKVTRLSRSPLASGRMRVVANG